MDRPANLVAAFQQVFAGPLSVVHALGPRVLTIGFLWVSDGFSHKSIPISCRAAHMVMEHQVLGMIDLGPPSQSQGTCKTRA